MALARALPLVFLITLAACGKAAPPALAVMPSDPKLANLYGQTCKSCHASGLSGAPLAGDKAAWESRVQQGAATLLDHAINGYRGMPPMGGCSDCSEADFNALIAFMAGAP